MVVNMISNPVQESGEMLIQFLSMVRFVFLRVGGLALRKSYWLLLLLPIALAALSIVSTIGLERGLIVRWAVYPFATGMSCLAVFLVLLRFRLDVISPDPTPWFRIAFKIAVMVSVLFGSVGILVNDNLPTQVPRISVPPDARAGRVVSPTPILQ